MINVIQRQRHYGELTPWFTLSVGPSHRAIREGEPIATHLTFQQAKEMALDLAQMPWTDRDSIEEYLIAQDEAAAEYAAERACEQYWENRGYEEARADEEREARQGIIPFSELLAQARNETEE